MLALTPNIAHPIVGSGPTFVSDMPTLRPMPDWAVKMGLRDARRALIWDSGQPVIELGVGASLAFAIVDSGAHQTIMSSSMAQALGLHTTADLNCGRYLVAGGKLLSYVGYVTGLLELNFGEGVTFRVSGVWLVDNKEPLFLLGKDVM